MNIAFASNNVTNNMTGVVYNWTANTNSNVANEGTGSGNINNNLINVTANNQTVTYVVTPSVAG